MRLYHNRKMCGKEEKQLLRFIRYAAVYERTLSRMCWNSVFGEIEFLQSVPQPEKLVMELQVLFCLQKHLLP